jgi:hypothetical protein
MDNFVTAKIYRLAAWTKPLPQPAQRELRLAFPKVSGSRWSDRHTTRGVKENLLQRAWQAALHIKPAMATGGCSRARR